ncbi:MAG: type II secretion system major pseudopilin GspG [Lentisphaeria bacterium]|nr:type II secretion system major pseudopilin GspG [Lentisphaeria bacterium]
MMKKKSPLSIHRAKQFTLIEIMIVVVIIAALAAMVAPRLRGRADQAKVSIAESDIKAGIANALKLYDLDNGTFPTTSQGLAALLDPPSTEPVPANWQGPYLDIDPLDPWQRPYKYVYPGIRNPHGFDLSSLGKDGLEGTEDDVVNWRK